MQYAITNLGQHIDENVLKLLTFPEKAFENNVCQIAADSVRDEMTEISQTTFSNSISWINYLNVD